MWSGPAYLAALKFNLSNIIDHIYVREIAHEFGNPIGLHLIGNAVKNKSFEAIWYLFTREWFLINVVIVFDYMEEKQNSDMCLHI